MANFVTLIKTMLYFNTIKNCHFLQCNHCLFFQENLLATRKRRRASAFYSDDSTSSITWRTSSRTLQISGGRTIQAQDETSCRKRKARVGCGTGILLNVLPFKIRKHLKSRHFEDLISKGLVFKGSRYNL